MSKGSAGAGSGAKSGGEPTTGSIEPDGERPLSAEVLADERGDGQPEEAGGTERSVDSLVEEIGTLRRELADARAAAERATRRASIERALAASGAIDLEITIPLVESVMADMDEPEIDGAVARVRREKAFLFRQRPGVTARGSAMAGEARRGAGLEDLAGDARSSGDRSDLLRYLRARRG